MTKKLKWAGRNSAKDQLRAQIWQKLEDEKVGIGDVWDSIPDFVGAKEAALRLSETKFWKDAKVVKSNPDAPQIPVRHKALVDGKLLYMPIPELKNDFPFLLLDPKKLLEDNISLEYCSTIEGALKHGQPVHFEEMLPMDVLVVGCVAVSNNGGRTGKGAGFADLEMGIFREVGNFPESSKVVTTVHDIQVVDPKELPIESHDTPLDYIFTPTQHIETTIDFNRPNARIDWNKIQKQQYDSIPFLLELRKKLEKNF